MCQKRNFLKEVKEIEEIKKATQKSGSVASLKLWMVQD